MSLKSQLKKTSLYKKWRHLQDKKYTDQMMKINYQYKEVIDTLLDPKVLQGKIEWLDRHREDPETPCYLINQSNTTVGIFGYINCFLPHIAYAVAKGYIPVIDMQTYDNIYIPRDKVGTGFNSWEQFFEQPMGYSVDNTDGKAVEKCPADLWYRWMPNSCPMMSDEEIAMWSTLFKKYIRFSEASGKYIRDEEADILNDREKTIGVIYRGTTYTKGQAKGHPIQPTMKMLADQVQRMMDQNGIEWIYLASDEKSIVSFFNNRFPGKVLINKRVYYDEVDVDYGKYNVDGTDIVGNMFDRVNNEYLIGLEYISSMNLVSNCSYFAGGACGGTTAVLYLNGLQYKERFVFELGKYGHDPVPEDQ